MSVEIVPYNPQVCCYKGNNKITEHRAIFQRESQNSEINKQTKSVNNRETGNRNGPDLVQAFLKKWWIESILRHQPLAISIKIVPYNPQVCCYVNQDCVLTAIFHTTLSTLIVSVHCVK